MNHFEIDIWHLAVGIAAFQKLGIAASQNLALQHLALQHLALQHLALQHCSIWHLALLALRIHSSIGGTKTKQQQGSDPRQTNTSSRSQTTATQRTCCRGRPCRRRRRTSCPRHSSGTRTNALSTQGHRCTPWHTPHTARFQSTCKLHQQMHKCTNAQMHKCTNAQMANGHISPNKYMPKQNEN